MADEKGTFEALGIEMVQIFAPVKMYAESGDILLLFAQMGVQFPESLGNDADFSAAITELVDEIQAMPALVIAIIDELKKAEPDYNLVGESSVSLVEKIVSSVENFITIKEAIEDFLNANPIVDIGDTLLNLLGDFSRNLLDFLLLKYLEGKSATLVAGLEFFGIAERTLQNEGSSNPLFPEFTKYRLHFDNIAEFFKNPADLLANLYNWGNPDFDGKDLLAKLHKLALSLGLPSVYTASVPEWDLMFFTVTVDSSQSPPGLNIGISEKISASAMAQLGNEDWKFSTEIMADLEASTGIKLWPGGEVEFQAPTASVDGEVIVRFTVPGDGGSPDPYILLGTAGASRFEFDKFEVEAAVGMTWASGPPAKATGRWRVQASLEEGKIIIKPANPDGFLAKILPEEGFVIDLSMVIGYDSTKGFFFEGSAGLEIQLPLHLQLGPLGIDAVTLAIKAGNDGIPIEIGADLSLNIGPFAAVVNGLGIKTTFTFPSDNSGNLGIANADIGFKPPSGVGLSLDAGLVKGGGFLSFDFDRGRYTGVIQLSIQEVINVTAIGLVTTKAPDGSPGFSMLLLITAEFTPIQLGFGFTLNGVGGLIGVNRTMDLQALRDGVRNNAIDNILFPSDPIAQVNQIIHDLETIFPQQQGRYSFGLMGKLGWGTPTLITLELGLILEVPNPIRLAILGVLKMVLPTEEAAILKLQVNFVGTIDFQAKYLTFDAGLFESKLLIFTLEGDMALRVKWGDESNFLFSIGGFHPDYTPPPLDLPDMNRLSISLLPDNPRLIITTYFAVTSNTVQFGAGVDFKFDVAIAKVTGYMNFDALFQFNPFYFKISLSAGLSVYIFGAEVMTIQLSGSLEGPTPWHLTGRVKIKIFWVINVNVSLDTTWGETKNTSLPDVDVYPELEAALENQANWLSSTEENSAGNDTLVRLRTIPNDDQDIIAHPNQSLAVSQKVVPFDIKIERFGTQKPKDYNKFSIQITDKDDIAFSEVDVKEEFAPVQFFNINGSDKLKRPSFEKYNSGVSARGTSGFVGNEHTERGLSFEKIIIDSDDRQVETGYTIGKNLFGALVKGGSARRSNMGRIKAKKSVLSPGKVSLNTPAYSIVDVDSLEPIGGISASSFAEAESEMRNLLASRPDLEGALNIVATHELVSL